jgi:hypothetical protein
MCAFESSPQPSNKRINSGVGAIVGATDGCGTVGVDDVGAELGSENVGGAEGSTVGDIDGDVVGFSIKVKQLVSMRTYDVFLTTILVLTVSSSSAIAHACCMVSIPLVGRNFTVAMIEPRTKVISRVPYAMVA